MGVTAQKILGDASMPDKPVSILKGKQVYLSDGKKLGTVLDVIVDNVEMQFTHLFVVDCDPELVEGGIHVAVPWRWIRGIEDVVILRWFPPTPIPLN